MTHPTRSGRGIGTLGTAARAAVGLLLLGSVVQGHLVGDVKPLPWVLGLVAFPASVLAAVRGYAGCEVLAVSKRVLRRDDQVGCVLFWPVDETERRMRPHAG